MFVKYFVLSMQYSKYRHYKKKCNLIILLRLATLVMKNIFFKFLPTMTLIWVPGSYMGDPDEYGMAIFSTKNLFFNIYYEFCSMIVVKMIWKYAKKYFSLWAYFPHNKLWKRRSLGWLAAEVYTKSADWLALLGPVDMDEPGLGTTVLHVL